jgi:hypothetical protein
MLDSTGSKMMPRGSRVGVIRVREFVRTCCRIRSDSVIEIE